MKGINVKRKNCVLGILMAVAMMIMSFAPMQVLAAENTEEGTVTLIQENDEYYNEAKEVLGLSDEEAQKSNIYAVDVNPSKMARVTIPNNGQNYNFPEFTFSGYNGGAYWTCQGTRLKWGYTWRGTYDSNYDLRLGVYLYRYNRPNDVLIDQAWSYNREGYTSNWLSASRTDYRFLYYCNYLTQSGEGTATVKMFVATQ